MNKKNFDFHPSVNKLSLPDFRTVHRDSDFNPSCPVWSVDVRDDTSHELVYSTELYCLADIDFLINYLRINFGGCYIVYLQDC